MSSIKRLNTSYEIQTVGTGTNLSLTSESIYLNGNVAFTSESTVFTTNNFSTTDNVITVNYGETGNGVTANTAGIVVDRGIAANVDILWNENNDVWELTSDGTNYRRIVSSVTGYTVLSDDLVPTLAANLNVNQHEIFANVGNITLRSNDTIITGNAVVSSSLNSTAFNNGALVVTGGLGVGSDVRIFGNLYVGNIISETSETLIVSEPLVYLQANAYPYNFDIGIYSHFIGGSGNIYQHTGFVRDNHDSTWKLFSNVAAEPAAGQIPIDSNTIYDPIVTGPHTINNAPTTALINGGTSGVGNIGASGATWNYGWFNNVVGTLQTAAQPNITSVGTLTSLTVSGLTTSGNITTAGTIITGNLTANTSIISGNTAGPLVQIVQAGAGNAFAISGFGISATGIPTTSYITVGSEFDIVSGARTTYDQSAFVVNTTPVVIDSFPTGVYRSAKYIIQVSHAGSGEYESSEVLVIHNGTTASKTQYALIHTGVNPLGTVSVAVNAGNMELSYTGANTSNAVKAYATYIKV